jgi:hypothetical protein
MAFSGLIDVTTPLGSEQRNLADDYMRAIKVAFSERLAIEHSCADDANDGRHLLSTKFHLTGTYAAMPAVDASYPGRLYWATNASTTVSPAVYYDTGTAWTKIATSDHGCLAGLTDDDHTQYGLADGTRAFSSLTVTGNASFSGYSTYSISGYPIGINTTGAEVYFGPSNSDKYLTLYYDSANNQGIIGSAHDLRINATGVIYFGSLGTSTRFTPATGNLLIGGTLGVTGAITGASYSGGAISGTTGTFSGTLGVTGAITGASYSGGAISGTTGAFSGGIVCDGDIYPTTNAARNLGAVAHYWMNLYVSNYAYCGTLSATTVTATGNISTSSGNIYSTNGNIAIKVVSVAPTSNPGINGAIQYLKTGSPPATRLYVWSSVYSVWSYVIFDG